MDTFLLYLISVNAVAFLAFAIDWFLCARIPELDEKTANALVLDVFPIAGGAIGMLLALFVFGGRGRGHRMNKDNIAWWFLAFVCLVVWALVIAARYGFVALPASVGSIVAGWNLGRLRILGIYLAVINVVTFAAFVWDKHVAATGNAHDRRMPEARLLGLSLVGGAVGGMLAMRLAHHKTRKWYFVWGLPVFVVLDVVVVLFAHAGGLI